MTIPFVAFWKTLARTDVDKTFSDSILPSKGTSLKNVEYITRNKTAALVEGLPTPTASSRAHDETFADSVLPSKTTNLDSVNYPKDLAANVLDPPDCPDTELTWDVGSYTSYTMTLQRRTLGSWVTVSSSISAGTEYYLDTGVTQDDTDGWRIIFNGLSGAAYTTITGVNTICPT